MSTALQKFQSPQAKRAFFISITGVLLSFFSGIWIILTYITDVFNKTGSSLSEKHSSLLVSIAPLFTNFLFMNIVERFNRKVCIYQKMVLQQIDIKNLIESCLYSCWCNLQTLYISSSILTGLCFFLFGGYCILWLNQPDYLWMPPLFFTCIILFNGLGLSPIPYILIIEIFPKDVSYSNISEHSNFQFNFFSILDSRNSASNTCFNGLVHSVCPGLHISIHSGKLWCCCVHDFLWSDMRFECNILCYIRSRNSWQIKRRNHWNYVEMMYL